MTPSTVSTVRRLFILTSYSPDQWKVFPSFTRSNPWRQIPCFLNSVRYLAGKSPPTTPINRVGAKKLEATAAWLAEPPNRRGFSNFGVLMESSAVVPMTRTLISVKPPYRQPRATIKDTAHGR